MPCNAVKDDEDLIIDIKLDDLICDNFKEIFTDIVECNYNRAVMNGGRSSTKSQNAATAIVVGTMSYLESAVAVIKYQNKIEERLVSTFTSAIRHLGVEEFWKLRRSPFEYVLLDDNKKETDVSIKFTGADNPENLKSFRSRSGGGFRYIWFEELTNFLGLAEVNNISQTLARGLAKNIIIMTYNPPMQTSNWCNKQYNAPTGSVLNAANNCYVEEFEFEPIPGKGKQLLRQIIHHSTYLDVIASGHADWLGLTFIGEAEKSKVENFKYYQWAYLGIVVGTDANVFPNVVEWDGNTAGLDLSRNNCRGYDWGNGGPDPCRFVHTHYDKKNRCLYVLDEFGKPKMSVDEVAMEMKARKCNLFNVICESAVPILNSQLQQKGIQVIPVKKGPDSVIAGIKWLQGLNGIFINKTKTAKTYKEFSEYEYKIDKATEEITSVLPDANNHSIDAVRYGNSEFIKYE